MGVYVSSQFKGTQSITPGKHGGRRKCEAAVQLQLQSWYRKWTGSGNKGYKTSSPHPQWPTSYIKALPPEGPKHYQYLGIKYSMHELFSYNSDSNHNMATSHAYREWHADEGSPLIFCIIFANTSWVPPNNRSWISNFRIFSTKEKMDNYL